MQNLLTADIDRNDFMASILLKCQEMMIKQDKSNILVVDHYPTNQRPSRSKEHENAGGSSKKRDNKRASKMKETQENPEKRKYIQYGSSDEDIGYITKTAKKSV